MLRRKDVKDVAEGRMFTDPGLYFRGFDEYEQILKCSSGGFFCTRRGNLLIIVTTIMISSMIQSGTDLYLGKYVSIEDETKANGIEIEENPRLCPQMNLMITTYRRARSGPHFQDLSR